MPWIWVAVILVLWIVAAFGVIALCMSVRDIDAGLGADRTGLRRAKRVASRLGARAKVE